MKASQRKKRCEMCLGLINPEDHVFQFYDIFVCRHCLRSPKLTGEAVRVRVLTRDLLIDALRIAQMEANGQ
jgi:hypothetical protein